MDFVRAFSARTELPVTRVVGWLGIARGKFFDWRQRYGKANEHSALVPRDHSLDDGERQAIARDLERRSSLVFGGFLVVAAVLDFHSVFGAFKVDRDGFQIAHKMVTVQWQDGKRVIVWPEELTPGKPRFPTPPWSHRP